jgi:MSHA biogenesis protein MshQ
MIMKKLLTRRCVPTHPLAGWAVPLFIALLLIAFSAQAVTDTFTASGTWTAPAGVTSVVVEVWAGGGAGGGNTTGSDGGGGGGGGGYSKSTIAVVPGNNYTVTVGAGGTGVVGGNGNAGGQSFFISAATVRANGGAGGATPAAGNGGAGGAGGALGVGTTRFSGGNGGQGLNNGTGQGGPGGSSAGTGANGTSASTPWTTANAGAPPAGGGIGGDGATNADGNAPASGYGGGGGGSGDTSGPGGSRAGGNGAGGQVILTYVVLAAPTVTTNPATALTATGATLNGTVSSNGASTTVTFDYGLTAGYGSSVTASASPLAAGASSAAVSAAVSGLNCNTTYHFRVNGVNSAGTTNGGDLAFTTATCSGSITASPTLCVNDNSIGSQAWGGLGNVTVSDNNYATATVINSEITNYLKCTGYNFAIPAGAVINGISVGVEDHSARTINDYAVQLVKSGTILATNYATNTNMPTGDAYTTYGGATDLWAGSWTYTDINNANFGVAFAAQRGPYNTTDTAYVDHMPITVYYTLVPFPTVSSIDTASANPTNPATAVAWTVVFSSSVTGVDPTDFVLVPAGSVTGATITSVTGSGTTWTVNANTGSGTGTLGLNLVDDDSIVDGGGKKLGGMGIVNGDFTGQNYSISGPFCSPPSNIPAGVTVTCVCDQFGRASLNPSTIFGGNWTLSHGTTDAAGTNPYINATTGLLRLTENTNNNAKAATVPSIFPAAGNYISVEFNNYAYQGGNTGADGIALTLSDYTIPAAPGGFGGSLGYAQRTDSTPNPPGFAGGWVGIALDEYGNFQNPTEGRIGGPGARAQSVGVRGPGSGTSGYRYMGGSASNPGGYSISANSTSATPATGYMYQVIVDARNSGTGTINVAVNRDATTKDGTNYSSIFGPFNAYTEANYALSQGWISQLVPDYWKISFTGSTGGSTNVHEIGSLRICAQTVLPATGGTASGFSAIDEAYTGSPVPVYSNFQTGDIYTKLAGTPFKLWVAALASTAISTGYSATSNKYVQVKIVDNSDNACGPDSARTCNSTCTNKTAVEAGATQIALFPSGSSTGVASPSPSFTLNSSFRNLVAVMKECTTSTCTAFTATAPACSADSFSVRPLSIASVTSSNATNATTAGTPIFKAGNDNFSLIATTTGVAGNPSGYNGVLKINNAVLQPASPATVAGAVVGSFPAATSATPSSTATGATFTYSEVGGFSLPGYNPATDTTSRRGVLDGVSTADECTAPGLTTAQCDVLKAATWTGVDSISTKGNCVADSYSNTKNAAGKYGCNFGLLANTGTFGRFVPDHFAVTSTLIVNRADFAVTGSVAAGSGILTLSSAAGVKAGDTISIAGAGAAGAIFSSTAAAVSVDGLTVTLATTAATTVTNVPVNVVAFTYLGEPMNASFTLTAQSAGNTTTKNYTGALAKLNPLAAVTAGTSGPLGFSMVNVAATRTPFTVCTATPADPCFTPSTASAGTAFINGVATDITVPLSVYRGASAVVPYAALNIGIAPVDSDGVTSVYDLDTVNVVAGANNHTSVGNSEALYGRIKISNAHGSELLPLPIDVTAQYWNGSGYVTSAMDNLSNFAASSVQFSNCQKLSATSTWPTTCPPPTSVSPASVVFVNGKGIYNLSIPGAGNTGSTDMAINVPGYLPSNTARATFGVYKGANDFIYLRENY